MPNFIDLTGMKFNHLTVIEQEKERRKNKIYWLCQCDCEDGNIISVAGSDLKTGNTKSCGCQKIASTKLSNTKNKTTHGMTDTNLFYRWGGMKDRCLNSNCKDYKNYGGRGISICEEWMLFENFYNWAIHNGYKKDLTIDRIDVNGNYCPENCRWISNKKQCNNRRNTPYLTIENITRSISEWSEISGIGRTTIKERIKRNWRTEDLLSKPLKHGEKYEKNIFN